MVGPRGRSRVAATEHMSVTQTSHRNQGRSDRRDRECCRGEYDFSRGERGRHHDAYHRDTSVAVLGLEAPETRVSTEKAATEGWRYSGGGVQADPRCDDGATSGASIARTEHRSGMTASDGPA